MTEQKSLFEYEEPWKAEWVGMPEFVQYDLTPWKTLPIHFATPGDMAAFAELIGQKLSENTRSVWFPEAEIGRYSNKRYGDES
jgi:hypothetical protein